MDFNSRYSHLNSAQKQAVDTIEGPVMVIAGPGTGKTELLSMRAANILKKTDVLPENILCLTFTDSGASAMRQRLVQIIGKDAYRVAIHTFHNFGAEVMNQNAQFFYHGANFRAADELSSYELLRGIFNELEYNNPLASKMNGEYTHLQDTLTTISELKKSGLTSDELLEVLAANDVVIDTAEPLLASVFDSRISKTTASELQKIIEPIRNITSKINLPNISPLNRTLIDSLELAIHSSQDDNSTKALTAWKNEWLKKNERGEFVLKSRDRQIKLRSVSFIYYQYLARMQESELYDFDDMILRVVHAMEVFPELRFNLQEKHQYIMVDEFQDTNMAQMRILYNLTNSEAVDSEPNILVVGDDDQAIYSFQGAEIGNIIHFGENFPTQKQITLTDNYRSTAVILAHARDIITQGHGRLENYDTKLDKTLTAHISDSKSKTELIELGTVSDERGQLVSSIEEIINSGVSPSSIAVLARRHHEIIALLPYFAKKGINVNYERRDNVLDLDVVITVERLARIIILLFEGQHDKVNALLAELLTHPAFAIDPIDIWRLSLSANNSHQSWMEVMATTPDFLELHRWLITQATYVPNMPLEQLLDNIIGTPNNAARTDEFRSPLYAYFFSEEKRTSNPDEYLTYLESLRTIRTKLREYQPQKQADLRSFIEFIELHRGLGSMITSIRPHSDIVDSAVNLMTAHKSKGQEFDHVYIIGAIDTAWGERVRSRSRLISYPENLPIQASGGDLDDRLRLFFVAMTRAKKQLIISYSTSDDNGKDTLRASFLAGSTWKAVIPTLEQDVGSLESAAALRWYLPVVSVKNATMKELLLPALEYYKLSATHLNNFLDVTRGGPEMFLLNNILRFPQAKSPSASYGSAIHATLHHTHSHLLATGNHRAVEDILHDFEKNLTAQYLSPTDFATYLQKGSDALQTFLDQKYISFTPSQKTELSFAGQHVMVGDAHLTGSLDLVDIYEKTIIVTDYKTGKPSRSWTGKTDFEKIKLHKYKQQLMFYKLLIEYSRDFRGYTVDNGILQFIEPTQNGEILALEATCTFKELELFTKLIQAVWKHITTLDLPDTSIYEPTYKGMLAFEKWLIDNN
ncbi:MAG: ATP-dependent DNA helicase [Candidatus Saccharimonadales bacterium]